jgi:hypothetical protein
MIFRSKHHTNFVLIENEAIRDPRLSFRATGLLAFLLSFPDDTRFSRDQIRRLKPDGVRGIRSALIELGQAGYLTHEHERDRWGRWRTASFIYETPRGTGEAFHLPPCENGAGGAKTARGSKTGAGGANKNGAGGAASALQFRRVTDGGKRATKRPNTKYEEGTTTTDPQGAVAVPNGIRPDLAVMPNAPASELITRLRQQISGAPADVGPLQQELLEG